MFCNQTCLKEGLKRFHSIECAFADAAHLDLSENCSGLFDPFEMLRILTESLVITQSVDRDSLLNQSMLMDDENPETLFDFDLGRKNDEWLDIKHLQIVNLLKPVVNEHTHWIFEVTALQILEKFPVFEKVAKSDHDCFFLVEYIARFMQIMKRNGSKIKRNHLVEGSGIQVFGSLLNHSCDPNVVCVSVDNKFACVVIKPIEKGQQLFKSYK